MVQPVIVWDPAPDATRDAVIFLVYAGVAILLSIAGAYAARKHSELAGFILVPCLCAAIMYENVAIGVSHVGALRSSLVVQGVYRLRCAVQCFIVPLFVTTLFELNYEVHKRRSANFCGCISFDRGHRRAGMCGQLVRYSAWFVALALLLLDIVVSAPYMTNPLRHEETLRYTNKSLGIYRTASGVDWTDTFDFVPTALLLLFSFYTGVSFWRYGTTMSTDVRTTALNPWISIIAASSGVTLAWVLTPSTWPLPYAFNATMLVLLAAIIITLSLVDLNLSMLETWAHTLESANEAVLLAMARNQKEREMLELIKAKRRLAPAQAAQIARRRMMAKGGDDDDVQASSQSRFGSGATQDGGQPREVEMTALQQRHRAQRGESAVGDGAQGEIGPRRGSLQSHVRRRQRSYSSDGVVRRNVTNTEADLNRMLDEVLHGEAMMEEGEDDEVDDDEGEEDQQDGDADKVVDMRAISTTAAAITSMSPGATAPLSPPRTFSMPALPPRVPAGGAHAAKSLVQPGIAAALAAAEASGGGQTEGGSFGRLAALVGARSRRTTPAHWRQQEDSWRQDEGRGPLWSRVRNEDGAAPASAAATSMGALAAVAAVRRASGASASAPATAAGPATRAQQQQHQMEGYASPAVRGMRRPVA